TIGTSARMDSVVAHPVTAGYSGGNVTVLAGPADGIQAQTHGGTDLGLWGDRTYVYGTALDAGEAVNLTHAIHSVALAPTRAVTFGWLHGEAANYTADGATILGQAVDW